MLRWVGAFAAVLIMVLLFVIWRLMQGPVELDWLTPYVEAALDRSGIGLKVAVSGVRIGIDRSTHQLDLRTENVSLRLPDGEPLARFPEMATSFGLGQLLRGRLAPTRLVVERPVLHLKRDAGGAISAQIGSGSEAVSAIAPQLVKQLAGPPEPNHPLGLLRTISIRGATVIVDDRRSGRLWQLNRVDFAVERGREGARGDVSFAMPIGRSVPELHGSYRYRAERQFLDLDLSIDGVDPAAIPAVLPELSQLSHLDAPMSAVLRTRIDLKEGRAQGSRLDVVLGSGRIDSEWLPAGHIAVANGELHAAYVPDDDEMRLENLALNLGNGARVQLGGTFTGVAPALIGAAAGADPPAPVKGSIRATLTRLPAQDLRDLWPVALSPGGRRWTLANIPDGMLDEAWAQMGVELDPAAHTAHVLHASGRLRFHDLTVTFLKGLPPVRKVGGTAVFAGNHIEFTPTGGTLNGVNVAGGSLRLTDLGAPVEWLTIDLTVGGPLHDALEVLNTRPLRYAHAVGIDPAEVGGEAETRLHFKLPLLRDLKFDAIDYGAKAMITNASLAKVAFGRGVRAGSLTLDIAPAGAHLHGTARYDDIPATLDASVPFHPKGEPRAVFHAAMTLDDAALRRLGLAVAPERLRGPVGLDLTYDTFAAKRSQATVLADLREAALAVPEAGWKKPPGQSGNAKIVLDLDNAHLTGIPQIAVTAPGLDGRLSAQIADDHATVERIDIRRLVVGDSELNGTVVRRAGGGWTAALRAPRLDARYIFKDLTGGAPASSSPPLALDARIGRLVLGPRRELLDVSAALLRTGGVWRSGVVSGRYANGRKLALRFGENGSDKVAFQSDDLGASLKLLDIADNVVGGQITLDGKVAEANGKRVLRAHFDGSGYTLTRASVLARLLALPSLTGIASTLSGSGLPFSRLTGDLVLSGGRVTLDRVLAYGEALGITGSGWIDTERDRLDVRGTVAPAYALNSLFGDLPIIGPLVGGGSQGLLAANYRVSGSTADPQVAVNPLSALAPGVLRQLFAPLVGFGAAPQQPKPR